MQWPRAHARGPVAHEVLAEAGLGGQFEAALVQRRPRRAWSQERNQLGQDRAAGGVGLLQAGVDPAERERPRLVRQVALRIPADVHHHGVAFGEQAPRRAAALGAGKTRTGQRRLGRPGHGGAGAPEDVAEEELRIAAPEADRPLVAELAHDAPELGEDVDLAPPGSEQPGRGGLGRRRLGAGQADALELPRRLAAAEAHRAGIASTSSVSGSCPASRTSRAPASRRARGPCAPGPRGPPSPGWPGCAAAR